MPRQSKSRRGGFVKVNNTRKQLTSSDLRSREAPQGLFRVISITNNKEVWLEGTFNTFLEAKKIADDKCGDGVVCYIHGSGPRVIYIAR
tara:strand:- start:25 stop:291 length:267 start_codon:yes stop_codon:yes gene_type:complete